ncbi:MAG: hypothetical protein FWJ90_23760 [Actinomadura sp.]
MAPLVAEKVREIGGRRMPTLPQDYARLSPVPLRDRDLTDGGPLPLEGPMAGRGEGN